MTSYSLVRDVLRRTQSAKLKYSLFRPFSSGHVNLKANIEFVQN